MNKKDIINLKKNILFKNYSLDKLVDIFQKNENKFLLKTYNKENIIYFQNDICNTFDIILSGEVIIRRFDLSGNTLIMNTFNQGSDISANLLFSNHNKYPMTIIAKNITRMIHINKELILELCNKDQDFLKRLLTSIGEKNYILTQKIRLLSLENLREQIVFYLKQRYLNENRKTLPILTTKKDLAEKLNVKRPSLSRTLIKLKKEGLIDYDNNTFFLLDKFPFKG
ncbi:MAG: Crp/Fnr family transcriptional regulator [Bacillota bacterium]